MRMQIIPTAILGVFGVMSATSANALEVVNVDWTKPDGGISAGLYSGIVDLVVEGTGQSFATFFNDAFYLYSGSPYRDANAHQLTFGTSTLTGANPSENAFNRLVGALPSYDPTHVYSIRLNTGTAVPARLHFGVGDYVYSDNAGSFRITITSAAVAAIPEPATWAMMLAGFAMVAGAYRHRRRTVTIASV